MQENKKDWSIQEGADDWECDWESAELFQMRYFSALSTTEKMQAVEDMCRVIEFFQERQITRQSPTSEIS